MSVLPPLITTTVGASAGSGTSPRIQRRQPDDAGAFAERARAFEQGNHGFGDGVVVDDVTMASTKGRLPAASTAPAT